MIKFIPANFQKNVLAHCILVDSSTVICWMSPFVILGPSVLFCRLYSLVDKKILLANKTRIRPGSALFAYDPLMGFQEGMSLVEEKQRAGKNYVRLC